MQFYCIRPLASVINLSIMRPIDTASGNANNRVGSLEKPLKIRLDSRRRLSRMPLPQQPKAASLFNNLNQAICVGTHSIEHQKQFLISMSDEVTKATKVAAVNSAIH
ncbi:hypothetical protein GPK29_01580 [Aeromonas hydrophila]|uniref:hypothetical protein n=1 Tax=Aeromonas hydrophila TaxID=644 RepID=UPI001C5BD5FF|nr:hypothetical protein [Aeromonas hydrophila]MBW3798205.1 hypothetical protein [Aeromonas hydrophila]MBW3799759.1 hypothetical protein [Aeromonas hydrophila]MBW3819629.1 hypothetical protein [Aeromonas hydrophila]